jgi:hypothetical protein
MEREALAEREGTIMTSLDIARFAVVCCAFAPAAAAQGPVRTTDVARSDASRSVTLSLAEYNRLMDLANRPPTAGAVAPFGAVLTSADVRVRVERDTVSGVFNVAGDVLRPGVNRVALVTGATLLDGTAGGRPLPLTVDGSTHAALLAGPGPFALTLQWSAPIAFAPGRGSFTLPVPVAGTAHATIDLPGDQADVHISAGLITKRSAADGRTTVDVTLRPGAATDVWWSMRDSAPVAAAREVRMLADVLTLITLDDSDVRMAALVDVTVVSGEPRTIDVRLPPGYEVMSVTGSSLESSQQQDGGGILTVADPTARRHQFLIALERSHDSGSFTLDTAFVSLPGTERERGDVAIEGVGTLDLAAGGRGAAASETTAGSLRRIDVRELNTALQSLARLPILSAFRYQRSAAVPAILTMDVTRFADAGVLAAVADSATATTLVTPEGRALTEIELHVQNRAQPYLKVALPPGATMVSVEVAGETAKPVIGADGTRVPLLRPGFRPTGEYTVSFVYLHAGTPFQKKGDLQMALPKMDVPVGVVRWEVFVPERYQVRSSDGNVIDEQAFAAVAQRASAKRFDERDVRSAIRGGAAGGIVGGLEQAPAGRVTVTNVPGVAGQIRGQAIDTGGDPLPGVTVAIVVGSFHRAAVTGADGAYLLAGVPSGTAAITARLDGFQSESRSFVVGDGSQRVDFTLTVGHVAETVTVAGSSPAVQANRSREQVKADEPSQNVINLQRRASGVLPVRVDVPRAGVSHRFVKPLVVDQETVVDLRYRRK